jgi:hypothetical protein
MKKCLVLILLYTAGCISSHAERVKLISSAYEAIIFDDGINFEEAKTIAQRELIKQNVANIYDLSSPRELRDVSDLPNYEKYWFIAFQEKRAANIEFIFVVLVNKSNGKVKLADDFKEDKRWILEAALLDG